MFNNIVGYEKFEENYKIAEYIFKFSIYHL